jgi:hypothetical protein
VNEFTTKKRSHGDERRVVVKFHLFSRSQSECLCLRPIIGMNRTKHRTVHMNAYKAAVNMIGTTTMYAPSRIMLRMTRMS